MTLDSPTTERAPAGAPAATRQTRYAVIDSDFHPSPKGIADLKPYLPQRIWDHIATYGFDARHGLYKGQIYPKAAPFAHRRDAIPEDGGFGGSDFDLVCRQYLEPCNIEYAIMSPLNFTGQDDNNLEVSAALSRAFNEWQIACWYDRDPRFRASVVIPYEDAATAVAEIERWGTNPAFAQVLMLTRTSEPLGRRKYWPIYEAAQKYGLPVGIHVFGASGHPTSPAGWPSYYMEDMTSHSAACQGMLASFALEGVFERFPDLKIINIEGGFAWLPSLEWRLDKHWERMRSEVPHLKRPPSEYLRSNLRISTQPFEEPERPKHLFDIMEWVGFDRLMFASDYPHWDFDDPASTLPPRLGPDRLQQILAGNARSVYRLG